MFKVYNGYLNDIESTSRMGEIMVSPADLVLAFGKPGESDGYKVSGEWTFHDEKSDVIFTVYDWKMTSLYSEFYMSPERLWASKDQVWINIGGNHKGDIDLFKRLILDHIRWVKSGKLFEKYVLGEPDPKGLFLTGNIEEEE